MTVAEANAMAREELVAEGMELVLTDGKVLEELSKTDKSLWEKIRDWIADVIDKIRKYYGELNQASKTAQVLKETVESLEEIERLFTEGVREAGERTRTAGVETVTRMNEENMHDSEKVYSFKGYAEDGKKIYESNFPKGTPKAAKSERILNYIQNVWSKKPIPLVISNGETSRTIYAQFDPTIDRTKTEPSDASKLAGGNRHGNHTEQRVTLDLADDYYDIASSATYNYSKMETGKDSLPHDGVIMWHYFVQDIYFAEHGSNETTPYTVTINVKEKSNGEYVYSFNAEKEFSTRQTLHADVSTRKGTNGELFLDDSITQPDGSVNTSSENSSENIYDTEGGVMIDPASGTAMLSVDDIPKTDREILGMALEGAVQSQEEYNIVKSYREQASMLGLVKEKRNGYSKEAAALERQIKALRSRMEDEGDPNGFIRKALDEAIAKKRNAEAMRDE